ncbi:putative Mg2+ transporter-C (MgtC) family protein [Anoxybacillus pushchinoensis]|uniref:Putative Mg2+ transporter-C (MgtC) family protein n=1 Tax=Anoxybacillus pushchinoensis TaxID=150248 RepID=A0A1I0UAI1_9BACL|nr:putative Mg2+ transporter-C (MgtC) family protein [Anoxybacillus pushchinoensis]
MDPLRLAAQIVSGIGFLGAGVILRRGNDSISGLTTAALIWGAAGVGVAVGANFYIEAILGVIFLIASVELIPLVTTVFGPKQLREKELSVKLIVLDATKISEVIESIRQKNIRIKTVRIKDLDNGNHFVELKVSVDQKRATTDVYEFIHQIPSIRGVDIENI